MRLLTKKNYLTMIHNLAKGEIHIFRNLYVEIDGKERDILDDGRLACGKVVSSVLYLNKLISDMHATVEGTEKDMLASGWQEIAELKPGAVLVWEKQEHEHIGFYVGHDEAISNDSSGSGFPWRHHVTYNNTRKIEKIYWHSELDNG